MRRERDVDDGAATCREEGQVGGEPRHALRRPDVEPRHRPPALALDRLGGSEVLAARVVDERVEPAAALEREAQDPLGVGGLAHVARDVMEVELRRGRGQHLLAPPADHYLGAAAAQLGRGRLPEPGSAARDQHGAPRERAVGEHL